MKKFFRYAFLWNQWLWFHIFAAALAAKMFPLFENDLYNGAYITLLAISWEMFEFAFKDIEKIYGDVLFFFYDACGDVLGAIGICFIILI